MQAVDLKHQQSCTGTDRLAQTWARSLQRQHVGHRSHTATSTWLGLSTSTSHKTAEKYNVFSPKITLWTGKRDNKQALASNFLPAVLRRQATDAWQKPHLSAQLQTPNRNGWWHLKFGAPIWGNIWSDFRIWTVPAVYHTFTSLLNTTLQRIRAFSGLQLLSPAAGLIPSLYFSQQETKPNHDSATTTTKKPLGSYGNRA